MATEIKAGAEQRLLNRELSTVEYNARLLELAADESLPLLERVKMCRFFSSNLDEFFMVRVAGLMGQEAAGLSVHSPDGLSPRAALDAIRSRVLDLTATQSKIWKKQISPQLAEQGIEIVRVDDLHKKELDELERRFASDVFPVLTPLGVGPGQPFPYISGLSLSLGILARDPESAEERFARVKVPEVLPRFLALGDGWTPRADGVRDRALPATALSGHGDRRAGRLPGHARCRLRAVGRGRRPAGGGRARAQPPPLRGRRPRSRSEARCRARCSSGCRRRSGSATTRCTRSSGCSTWPTSTRSSSSTGRSLKYHASPGITSPRLARLARQADLFDEIRRGDVLVHQPYESFATSFEAFVRAAARDPNVITMKTAVYRTSGDSPLIPALIEAAEDGKQTVCLVELKARFDESRNIEWARKLEQAGVHVVYGFPDLKVHAKLTLVVRREPDGLRRYVHIGTGNYHAVTARTYEDVGLFTADEAIAADVAALFNHLTGFGRPDRFSKILVAPFALRAKLVERIRAVANAAADGKRARIRLKVNALTDDAIVEELYAAAQQGARVEVCARSMCILRPGVDGLSKTIHVRSIVGRFLEHSRLFSFEAGDSHELFLGSADLMERNLDRRIEVLVPVEGSRQRQELIAILDSAFADNVSSWELGADGLWRRLSPAKGERAHNHQEKMQRRAKLRVRRAARAGTL